VTLRTFRTVLCKLSITFGYTYLRWPVPCAFNDTGWTAHSLQLQDLIYIICPSETESNNYEFLKKMWNCPDSLSCGYIFLFWIIFIRIAYLRTIGRSNPGGARFSAYLQTGLGAHPSSFAKDTASFCGVKQQSRGVNYATHSAPRLKKE
jgi:hypothetical protein